MYKEIIYDMTADTKIDKSLKIELLDSFVKTASVIPDYLKEWVASVKRKPNHTYVLVSAVGAGEYWGSNKNGDYFPEEALLGMQEPDEIKDGSEPVPRYLTFMKASFFKHHNNKPYSPKYGYVAGAFYDHKMHKVVLIIGVDNEKAPDIAKEIEEGKIIAVSMGCKVPYDVCSICGNKAKTRADYCKHLRKMMNHILPDGRKVYAINTKPRFFDISYVTRPAWRGGWSITKVASCYGDKCSAQIAEEVGTANRDIETIKTASTKNASMNKEADIFKEIEGRIVDLVREESLTEPNLPRSFLEYLSTLPLPECWGTLLVNKIIPKPNEFAYLLLKNEKPELAEQMLNQTLVFDPRVKPIFKPQVEIIVIRHISFPKDVLIERSFEPDILKQRLFKFAMEKRSGIATALLLALGLAGLYKALRINISKETMAPVLLAGQAYRSTTNTLQPKYIGTYMLTPEEIDAYGLNKEAGYKYIPAAVAPYIYAAYSKKTKPAEQQNIVAKNPGKTALGAISITALAEKGIKSLRRIK